MADKDPLLFWKQTNEFLTNLAEVRKFRETPEERVHMFNTKLVGAECKPVTNQKNFGRCWIITALNIMSSSKRGGDVAPCPPDPLRGSSYSNPNQQHEFPVL